MALNFPGPYEVRINYQVGIYAHTARLNFQADADYSTGAGYLNINALNRLGGVESLSDKVTAYCNAIAPFLSAANSEITDVEVWKITPGSFQGVQIASSTLNIAGTSAAATIFASQLILSLRTQEGGILKANVMNNTTAAALPILPSNFSANVNAWVDQFELPSSIWLGRDTSYCTGALRLLPGQNEALFKRIYRST